MEDKEFAKSREVQKKKKIHLREEKRLNLSQTSVFYTIIPVLLPQCQYFGFSSLSLAYSFPPNDLIFNMLSPGPPPCKQPTRVMPVSVLHVRLMNELFFTWMTSSIMGKWANDAPVQVLICWGRHVKGTYMCLFLETHPVIDKYPTVWCFSNLYHFKVSHKTKAKHFGLICLDSNPASYFYIEMSQMIHDFTSKWLRSNFITYVY